MRCAAWPGRACRRWRPPCSIRCRPTACAMSPTAPPWASTRRWPFCRWRRPGCGARSARTVPACRAGCCLCLGCPACCKATCSALSSRCCAWRWPRSCWRAAPLRGRRSSALPGLWGRSARSTPGSLCRCWTTTLPASSRSTSPAASNRSSKTARRSASCSASAMRWTRASSRTLSKGWRSRPARRCCSALCARRGWPSGRFCAAARRGPPPAWGWGRPGRSGSRSRPTSSRGTPSTRSAARPNA